VTATLRSLCRPRPLYTVQPNTWHKHNSRLRIYDSDILCVWLHWSFWMTTFILPLTTWHISNYLPSPIDRSANIDVHQLQ